MLLDREHLFGQERARPLFGHAPERAIALVSPGAAGDLRHLSDGQPPGAASVELVQPGKGDMRDVHVEAHADRIGCNQIIDLACLKHRDLCVAGARGEGAHHHRRAAAQAPQHLGDGIDLLRAERDDRGTLGQAADLLGARIGQFRKARPPDDLRIGHQRADHRPERFGAEDHRLLAPAPPQQPIGEDVPALRVRPQLRLVQPDKGDVGLRHRFDRTQMPARVRGYDLFLARHQRDLIGALQLDDAVVHFARQ